jgi:hypothetical protein
MSVVAPFSKRKPVVVRTNAQPGRKAGARGLRPRSARTYGTGPSAQRSVPCFAIPAQVAQKIDALTEPEARGRPNPRARDVLHVLLLLQRVEFDHTAVRAGLVARHAGHLAKSGQRIEAQSGSTLAIALGSRCVYDGSRRPPCRRSPESVPSATAAAPAAVAAPSLRSASAYSAISAFTIGAKRPSDPRMRASARPDRLRSPPRAGDHDPTTTPKAQRLRASTASSSARSLPRGGMMGRWIACTPGATFCRSDKA